MTPYELAKEEVGTLEWRDGHNPKVLAYFKDAKGNNISDDETPWCAAFVGAMLERSGIQGTRALNARSYLEWGDVVDPKDAREGDILIFKRGTSSWQGHVAFWTGKQTANTYICLGGNQSDAVTDTGRYSKSKLLGVRRWPTQKVVQPTNIIATIITAIMRALGVKK